MNRHGNRRLRQLIPAALLAPAGFASHIKKHYALLAGLCLGLVAATATVQAGNEDRLGVLVDGEEETSILIIRDYFIEDAGLNKAIVVTRNSNAMGANTVVPIMRNAGPAGPASISGIIRASHLDTCKQVCDPTGPDITYHWRLSGPPFDTVADCIGDTAALVEKLCRGQLPGTPLASYPRTPGGPTPPPTPPPGTPPPPPGTPCASWREETWTPEANTVCAGTDVDQTRVITKLPVACTGAPPGPVPATNQTVPGTKVCPPGTPPPPPCSGWSLGNWTPARNTRCSGTTFTQTRPVAYSPAGCTGTPPGSAPHQANRSRVRKSVRRHRPRRPRRRRRRAIRRRAPRPSPAFQACRPAARRRPPVPVRRPAARRRPPVPVRRPAARRPSPAPVRRRAAPVRRPAARQ